MPSTDAAVHFSSAKKKDYLAGKGLWDIAPARIGQLARLSCRFWAAYVALYVSPALLPSSDLFARFFDIFVPETDFPSAHSQLAHLYREKTLIAAARQAVITNRVKKVKDSSALSDDEAAAEKAEVARIAQAEKRVSNDFLIQAGYAPLTMHWSVSSLAVVALIGH